MKKIICLVLTLVMAACLAACTENTPSTEPSAPAAALDGFVFTYQGTQIPIHADAAPILQVLGEPKNYTEETSCAFSGLDKTYYFGSFYLKTYPIEDKDYVFGLWFADDSVSSDEGLYIGMPEAQAKEICGEDSYNGTNAYIQTRNGTKLTVIIQDGVVFSVQYEAIVN